MRDLTEHRLRLARGGALMFVLTLGWAAWQSAGLTPVSAETPPPVTVLPSIGAADAIARTRPLAPIRLEWLSLCDATRDDIGLYTTEDGVCAPSRAATLGWLQSQLTMMRVLSEEEYLQRATIRDWPACGALILSADAHVGWICLDAEGLYRADRLGHDLGPRWQLHADGGWLFAQ